VTPLRIARTSLVLLGGLYVVGGLAAVATFVQMRAGSAELAVWFASNGMPPPTRFLVIGLVYCAVGLTSVSAARVLRRNNLRGLLLASFSIVLVTLDVFVDLYRRRITGFDWADVVGTGLTCVLLLLTAVCLVQSRRRVNQTMTA
jgi:hypothetical protein